jgi:hypothetical protein
VIEANPLLFAFSVRLLRKDAGGATTPASDP